MCDKPDDDAHIIELAREAKRQDKVPRKPIMMDWELPGEFDEKEREALEAHIDRLLREAGIWEDEGGALGKEE